MIPYADFTYFGILLYVVIPSLVMGLAGLFPRGWALIATLTMLAVQYAAPQIVGPHIWIREVWLLGGYALFQWGVAAGFLRIHRRERGFWDFYVALVLTLLPLAAAKFLPLVAPRYRLGFLGISYLTFRNLDVIFSLRDGLITSLPAGRFFAYLLFFPTISAGPIDRFRRFAADWGRRRARAEFLQDLDGAVHRIFTGFLYKYLLAYLIKRYWMDPVSGGTGFWNLVSYMYAYSFYLFFDFAGYSAFAVGLSYLFGIHTPENFNRPFLAHNIRDFWDRWHISLSWWFRDHVYMRFVLAAARGRWFKSKYLASYLGFFLSMGLMGVWHGAQWHYILYGLYHGLLMTGYDLLSRWNKRRRLWGDGPLFRFAGIIVTFNLVCFGFLLFSGRLG